MSANYTVDYICRDTGEMVSDLNGSHGSRNFLSVAKERKSSVAAWARCCWLVRKALLTRMLPMFLACL